MRETDIRCNDYSEIREQHSEMSGGKPYGNKPTLSHQMLDYRPSQLIPDACFLISVYALFTL
jgi:hypothetical protein